jgi:hypothetical protein
MKEVVMTFNTVDAAGQPNGATVDVDFGVDDTATPKNSVTRLKLTSSASPAGTPPLEFKLVWSDSWQLGQTIINILSANPVPPPRP